MICLCICNCASTTDCTDCCICICNRRWCCNCQCSCTCSCSCVCICICKKPGERCNQHNCKGCLIKINLSELQSEIFKIIDNLYSIASLTDKLDRHKFCESYCCCQEGQIDYKSIMSKITEVLILFKNIGTIISLLIRFKNILSNYSKNETTCKSCQGCKCKEKIKNLIGYSESAVAYFSLFRSRLYKLSYLWFLRLSVKQNVKNLTIHYTKNMSLNNQLISISTNIYNHILSCLSLVSINESYFQSSYLSSIVDHMVENLETLKPAFKCCCVCSFEKEINKSCLDNCSTTNGCEFNITSNNIVDNSDNHFCLCLVIKHRLIPCILKFTSYILYIYGETSNTYSRKHGKYIPNQTLIWDMSKLIFLVLGMIEKIVIIMERRYIIGSRSGQTTDQTSNHKIVVDTKISNLFDFVTYVVYCLCCKTENNGCKSAICFCKVPNDQYYGYLVSLIIFTCGLVDNSLRMYNEGVREGIKSAIWMMSDYHSMDYYPHRPNISENQTDSQGKSVLITITETLKKLSTTIIKSVSNGNSNNLSMLLHNEITELQNKLISNGIESFFKFIISGLCILIKTPLFTLVYSNISDLAFYIVETNRKILGFSMNLRTGLMRISFEYLNRTQEPSQQCSCNKNGCKICICTKSIYLSLYIVLKMIKYVLANVIMELITSRCVKLNTTIIDINRININNTEMILKITKNNRISDVDTHSYVRQKNIANSFPRLNMGFSCV